MEDNNYTCDVCNMSNETVIAGRWIFYCPAHKARDRQLTQDNELSGDWVDHALNNGELSELAEELFN